MNEQYRPAGFSLLPAVVKNLLIINGLVFLAQIVAEKAFGIRLEDMFGLRYPGAMDFRPWQFVTYMFLHGSLPHVAFNMLALWMFGYLLENIWGPKRFLIYYFVTGIGAALVHYLVIYIDINPLVTQMDTIISDPTAPAILDFIEKYTPQLREFASDGSSSVNLQKLQDAINTLAYNPDNKQALFITKNFLVDYREYFLNLPNVIGASGAVFGILLAFGMLFPNTVIYLYFLFPIKAKYFVIGYGLLELYFGVSGTQSNVAHFAHLGGMVFGFFLILYWKKRGNLY